MCASVMDARVGLLWSALQPSLVTTRSHSVTQPSTPAHTNSVPADMQRDCHAPVETRRSVFFLLLSSVSPPLLLISSHVNGSSSVASPSHVLVPAHRQPAPAPGYGASLHHQPSPAQPAQPSPAQPRFYFLWESGGLGRTGHWAGVRRRTQDPQTIQELCCTRTLHIPCCYLVSSARKCYLALPSTDTPACAEKVGCETLES